MLVGQDGDSYVAQMDMGWDEVWEYRELIDEDDPPDLTEFVVRAVDNFILELRSVSH